MLHAALFSTLYGFAVFAYSVLIQTLIRCCCTDWNVIHLPECADRLRSSLVFFAPKICSAAIINENWYSITEELTSCITQLYFTGGDTTTISLTWMIFYLINQSDVQEKIHQEICDNIGKQKGHSRSSRVTSIG